ncbi:hypothetical protein DBV05_g7976 [Lasiodiplodia theobromae]|uniref:Uncharacterized protein n=1 Tax=Lasiodiplodia theobromae TaxID=45133 RepID=A0A5N5D6Z8_9PEZI|nr:hypothetical protein DBV05_g7976 [Lasiodiplodia theobromae]
MSVALQAEGAVYQVVKLADVAVDFGAIPLVLCGIESTGNSVAPGREELFSTLLVSNIVLHEWWLWMRPSACIRYPHRSAHRQIILQPQLSSHQSESLLHTLQSLVERAKILVPKAPTQGLSQVTAFPAYVVFDQVSKLRVWKC